MSYLRGRVELNGSPLLLVACDYLPTSNMDEAESEKPLIHGQHSSLDYAPKPKVVDCKVLRHSKDVD